MAVLRTVYAVITCIIVWQAGTLFLNIREQKAALPWEQLLDVTVTGNVEHPGIYRVRDGMTQFEILKVAGVLPTSDISTFALSYPLTNNQKLDVGTRSAPVAINTTNECIRLEYASGDISVLSEKGNTLPVQPGMIFYQNDRIKTNDKNQAELSVNTYSKISLDGGSEMVFNKSNAKENNKTLTEVSQLSGLCWYKISYASSNDVFVIILPNATVTVTGKGADFVIDSKPDGITISTTSGQILINRQTTSEAINLSSGQQTTLYSDNRALRIAQATSGINAVDRFSKLTLEKNKYTSQSMPLNFLFCATPGIYYIISVHYESGIIQTIRLPSFTSVDQFAPGVQTLDQAYLYGGPAFVCSIAEQLLSARISKYCIFDKEDVVFTTGAIGGIDLNLDAKAAAKLQLAPGMNKLNEQQVIRYLKTPGLADFEDRQVQIFVSCFNELKSRNLVLTATMIEQILSQVQSNFSVLEILNYYNKFAAQSNWSFTKATLPIKQVMENGKLRYEPVLEESSSLLQVK
jgi:hypothetical protein